MNSTSRYTLTIVSLAAAVICAARPHPARAQQILPPLSKPAAPAAAAVPTPAMQKAARAWQTAIHLQKANRLSDAVEAYNDYLRQVKAAGLAAAAMTPAYQNLATIYRGQGKIPPLLEVLNRWVALAPANAALHAELASIYGSPRFQRFDEALKEARKALALKPIALVASAAHAAIGIVGVARRDFALAEQEFGASLKFNPGNGQLEYDYALALVERRKLPQALMAMNRAARLNPRMTGAWFYIAILNESLRKYSESIDAFHHALRLAPKDPTIYSDLARVQVRSGDINGAITSYLFALEFAPQSVPTRITVAQLFVQQNNYAAARTHFTEAVKFAPKSPVALAGLAACEAQLSYQPQDAAARSTLLKQAEEHFRAAAALDTKYETDPNGLARFYERTGSLDKARAIYSKHMEADAGDFYAVNALAGTYLMQRKPDEAIAIWRRFSDAHPDNAAPYMRIAETFETEAKWEDAVAEWKLLASKQVQPATKASAMVATGRDLARAGKPKEATDQLQAVLKLDTSAATSPKEIRIAVASTLQAERLEAMHELADIAEKANKLDEAIDWLRKVKAEEAATAIKASIPPNSDTYLSLARLYQRANKPDLAVKELDELTQTQRGRRESLAPAFEALAQLYESLKRYDDAILAYRRSALYSRDPLSARLRIAEVYQRSGRLPLAVTEYESIQRDFPREMRALAPLALAYRQAGRDEDAIRVYDDLLKGDRNATWARDQKAAVLTSMKRYDDARALYESQLLQNPQNRQLYADIAFVYQSEGKPDAFLDWATPRLAKAPANPTLMAVILDETIRQKREEQGWALLRVSAEKNKGQRAVLEATATIMAQRDKRDDAVSMYRLLADQFPKDLTAQLSLADALFATGHKDEATKLYTGLIARTDLGESERLNIRREYARACIEQGNSAEAIGQLKAVVDAEPNDFDSATKLAQALDTAGRGREAIPVLQSLAMREVYSPAVRAQIRNKLGGLFLKGGDKTQATAEYKKAVELNPKDTASAAALAELAKG